MVVGIDVAADRLNCVALDDAGAFAGGRLVSPADLDALIGWARDADVIAIDAPAALSTAPHADCASLSPKFRRARCGEIALGRDHGIWVPWTSPTGPPVAGWMATGLDLYEALHRSLGAEVIEVFPYAGFRALLPGIRLERKTSVAGARRRIAALRDAGLAGGDLELWSHDSVDAAMAALVALHRRDGSAVAATCGHDGSAIWLPAGAHAATVR